MNNDKHSVTFDGEPVTRAISIADVKAYMVRKGFRFANRFDNGESWTLAAAADVDEDTRFVYFDAVPCLKATVQDVAFCLDAKRPDVLREIAGEAVTLEDAIERLADALPDRAKSLTGPSFIGTTVSEALNYAINMRAIALDEHENGPDENERAQWLRVADAAEDLATIALADLRRARKVTP